jgi:hypothetical protein
MKHPTITILDRMLEKIKIFRKHEDNEAAIEKGEVITNSTPEQRKDLYELQLSIDKKFDDMEDLFKKLEKQNAK